MEGVMQRTDMVTQLTQQLQAAQENIKKLQGDLQTRDREAVNLRKRVEVEKFKADLDKLENKAAASGTLFEKRLDDNLATVKRQIAEATKETGSPSGSKEATKKGKKK
jgi:TolA-binding protein